MPSGIMSARRAAGGAGGDGRAALCLGTVELDGSRPGVAVEALKLVRLVQVHLLVVHGAADVELLDEGVRVRKRRRRGARERRGGETEQSRPHLEG